jgi:hypothetical protein
MLCIQLELKNIAPSTVFIQGVNFSLTSGLTFPALCTTQYWMDTAASSHQVFWHVEKAAMTETSADEQQHTLMAKRDLHQLWKMHLIFCLLTNSVLHYFCK